MSTRILLFAALCASSLACADAPPIYAFARRPAIENMRISPDGRYLLYVSTAQDAPMVVTIDRRDRDRKTIVIRLRDHHPDFDIWWCAWANETRVLCGLRGVDYHPKVSFPITGLIAVNANGSDYKGLASKRISVPYQTSATLSGLFRSLYSPEYQDEVIDVTPARPDSVLIPVAEDPYASVYELNVYTGIARGRFAATEPILSYRTDGRGNLRLGSGFRGRDPHFSYLVRPEGEKEWRLFALYKPFERRDGFTPVGIAAANRIYAVGAAGVYDGLWELDLADQQAPPRLLFSDAEADIRRVQFTRDGQLFGVAFETDKPFARYVGARANRVIEGANRFLPDTYNEIYDFTADEQIYVVRSTSDVDAGSFHLLDVGTGLGDLELVGTAHPALDKMALGRMRAIEFAARDGTRIPGYLTLPPEQPEKNLPVIVMPHDGPDERDSWTFDYLRLFLASRGYAVMQMNYRGSAGYGWEWLHAAHQDWAGLTYDDISDGARWASTQSFADPKRMCILGRGFGGYASLLGAMRNEGLFRCAISIGGISDLEELKDDSKYLLNSRIVVQQIGKGRKGKKADSPLRDAEDIVIPVLLIHGTHDWVVNIAHSKRLAAMLKLKHMPYEFVAIDKAEHDFRRESERATLLERVERFLANSLQ